MFQFLTNLSPKWVLHPMVAWILIQVAIATPLGVQEPTGGLSESMSFEVRRIQPIWEPGLAPKLLVERSWHSESGEEKGSILCEVDPGMLWETQTFGKATKSSRPPEHILGELSRFGAAIVTRGEGATVHGGLVVQKSGTSGVAIREVGRVLYVAPGSKSQALVQGIPGVLVAPENEGCFLFAEQLGGRSTLEGMIGVMGWTEVEKGTYCFGIWIEPIGQDLAQEGGRFLEFRIEESARVQGGKDYVQGGVRSCVEVGRTKANEPFAVGFVNAGGDRYSFRWDGTPGRAGVALKRIPSIGRSALRLLPSASNQKGLGRGDSIFLQVGSPQYLDTTGQKASKEEWKLQRLAGEGRTQMRRFTLASKAELANVESGVAGLVEAVGIAETAAGEIVGAVTVTDRYWTHMVRICGFSEVNGGIHAEYQEAIPTRDAIFHRADSVLCWGKGNEYYLVSPSRTSFSSNLVPTPSSAHMSLLKCLMVNRQSASTFEFGEARTVSLAPYFQK